MRGDSSKEKMAKARNQSQSQGREEDRRLIKLKSLRMAISIKKETRNLKFHMTNISQFPNLHNFRIFIFLSSSKLNREGSRFKTSEEMEMEKVQKCKEALNNFKHK
jgi:hypothetical protein